MKKKISDWMDYIQDDSVPIRLKEIASSEKIKEATMKKIHAETKTRTRSRKASRVLLVAAAAAMALCVTVSAAVTVKSGGFVLLDGMSGAEIRDLIDDASVAYAGAYEDADGTVHYLDENGNETLVLAREEAAAYELAQIAEREQTVRESTTLVDLSTMQFLPNEATELSSGEDGRFADFALSNGGMVLLYPEGKDAYGLKAGDTVTITLDANDECYLEFGCFKDGAYLAAEAVRAGRHSYTFTIQENGLYCFYVEYYSAGMSAFRNCAIVIE